MALGHGGQVLLSAISADFVRENPPQHVTLADLSAHAFKDIERHEHVYQLAAPALHHPDVALSLNNLAGSFGNKASRRGATLRACV